MRTQIFNALKITALAIALSFGMSYALAWTAPTVVPTGGNVSAPLNTGDTIQTKAGALNLVNSSMGPAIGLTGKNVAMWNRSSIYSIDEDSGKSFAFGTRGNVFSISSETVPNNAQRFVINHDDGKVGIGTTDLAQTLTVAGSIGATGDICTTTTGPSICLSTGTGSSGASGMDPTPIGSIVSFAGATAPSGYLLCDGSAVSRTSYASLFAVIGTTYGSGDGSTTFNLPDLRGEFVRGLDNGKGIDAGRLLGSSQGQAIQSHTHSSTVWTLNQGYMGSGAGYPGVGTTGATGGPETRPRNVALNYIIKATSGITDGGLGYGQTWQNVTASRARDVTYTNSTGKPIQISVILRADSGPNDGYVYVDGVEVWYFNSGNYVGNIPATIIVPSGSTYRVWTTRTTNPFRSWNELR